MRRLHVQAREVMIPRRYTMLLSTSVLAMVLGAWVGLVEQAPSQEQLACAADIRNLNITSAELVKVSVLVTPRASQRRSDCILTC